MLKSSEDYFSTALPKPGNLKAEREACKQSKRAIADDLVKEANKINSGFSLQDETSMKKQILKPNKEKKNLSSKCRQIIRQCEGKIPSIAKKNRVASVSSKTEDFDSNSSTKKLTEEVHLEAKVKLIDACKGFSLKSSSGSLLLVTVLQIMLKVTNRMTSKYQTVHLLKSFVLYS